MTAIISKSRVRESRRVREINQSVNVRGVTPGEYVTYLLRGHCFLQIPSFYGEHVEGQFRHWQSKHEETHRVVSNCARTFLVGPFMIQIMQNGA